MKTEIKRQGHLAPKIVMIDGQPGCGKTMLSPIISALDRVELLSYIYEMEYTCAVRYLGQIDEQAAEVMVRLMTDLKLYNVMMSRDVNFRYSDLSSVWRDIKPWRYVARLFKAGDERVPGRIKEENPILNLTTHNLVPFCQPILNALQDRVCIIEVVRHPLYMVKQQALNMERLVDDPRNFTLHLGYKGYQMPYWVKGWEELYLSANAVERAVYAIEHLTQLAASTKASLPQEQAKLIITVPFEEFVLNPWSFLREITGSLKTSLTPLTHRMMRQQKVPRKKIADGLALDIYKRCGWVPSTANSEEEELASRRNFVLSQASPACMAVLDRLSINYEEQYMGGKKTIPGRDL